MRKKLIVYGLQVTAIILACALGVCAQEASLTNATQSNATQAAEQILSASTCAPAVPAAEFSAEELIQKARAAYDKQDFETTLRYTQECVDRYKDTALAQQKSFTAMPTNDADIQAVPELNDVAMCYFIRAETLRDMGRMDEAVAACQTIIETYPYAKAWEPRGWFWVVADVAKKIVEEIQGTNTTPGAKPPADTLKTRIVLFDQGKEDFIHYEKYGQFQNIGTKEYKYVIKNSSGLSAAAGEGVYPNTSSARKDPELKKAIKEGRLDASQWELFQSQDLEAAFLKWVTCSEPQGIRQYYTAMLLERSGEITQAIKAYYAIVVHFPYSYGWTYWHTPWYLAQAAIGRIHFLLRTHPELGYRLVDASVRITNGFDNEICNDIVVTNPGRFIKITPWRQFLANMRAFIDSRWIKKAIGNGRVQLVQFRNGDWQLHVDKKPFMVKGITYTPTRVGESPDKKTMANWMEQDINNNGLIDGPYEAFADRNLNNKQDADEPVVGDFQLMKDMGVNTIRLYHQPFPLSKKVLLELYDKYGIMVAIGDFLGKYALGSKAEWQKGTDYTNPEHRKNMMESVLGMVREFKDEPYVLMWILGNENVYGVACNADKKPEAFFSFCSEVAREIKKIDPNHPVALANGDTLFLDMFAEYGQDVDIFGANIYRGDAGFGYYWQQIKDETGKPAMITEYGSPAYALGYSEAEAQDAQAEYLKNNWQDIASNAAFGTGAGNAIGGYLFEWLDEWWKAYDPVKHDTKALYAAPVLGGYIYEEWFGVAGQGDGSQSPYLRQLRKSYFVLQELWR